MVWLALGAGLLLLLPDLIVCRPEIAEQVLEAVPAG